MSHSIQPAPYQVMPPLSADERAALKADIAERGVQVPVEYDDHGNILDGHHRIEICNELGITHWPRLVRYGLTEAEKRRHARRLNLDRRHLDGVQKRELIAAELREMPEASNRKIAAGLGVDDKTVGNVREGLESTAEIPQLKERKGKDDRVRRVVQYVDPSPEGIRGSKLTAKTILKAERDANSEGRTNLQKGLSDRSAELPGGRKVPVVYADPATKFLAGLGPKSTENHYKTMTTQELCDLPVGDRTLPNCELYIWSTVPQLVNTIKIANAWGFPDYSSHIVWDKTSPDHPKEMGPGYVFRNQHELLLRFTRGSPVGPKIKPLSIYRERKREHSRKPDYFRQMIIDMTRGLPTIELFARVDAEHPLPEGWESWGNQAAPFGPDSSRAAEAGQEETAPVADLPASVARDESGRIVEVKIAAGNASAEIYTEGDVPEEALEERITDLMIRTPPVPAEKIVRVDASTGEIIARRESETLNGGHAVEEALSEAVLDSEGREFIRGGMFDPEIARQEAEFNALDDEQADTREALRGDEAALEADAAADVDGAASIRNGVEDSAGLAAARQPTEARPLINNGGDHETVANKSKGLVLDAGAVEMPNTDRAVSENRAAPAQSSYPIEMDEDGYPIILASLRRAAQDKPS